MNRPDVGPHELLVCDHEVSTLFDLDRPLWGYDFLPDRRGQRFESLDRPGDGDVVAGRQRIGRRGFVLRAASQDVLDARIGELFVDFADGPPNPGALRRDRIVASDDSAHGVVLPRLELCVASRELAASFTTSRRMFHRRIMGRNQEIRRIGPSDPKM
ncbi:hypothetical protein [Corynebacterium flavescens]|uniref:hypothetical protein n=1 Tax=Corynebacterium flavescens TaxID=28028 RepID=UPI003FD294C7